MKKNDPDYISECDLFHEMTVKQKRRDVSEVYYAIQSALAFNAKRVDVGCLAGKIMPPGRLLTDCYCSPIGPEGLAHFSFLFDIELVKKGSSDYHDYRFKRKTDGASVIAYLKTSCNPDEVEFDKRYEAYLKKLTKLRTKLIESK